MAAPYLGGMRITKARYVGQTSLLVSFNSSYGSTYVYQLYRGRTLVGVSRNPNGRSVVGRVPASDYPEHLTLLAVSPGKARTDYGSTLPLRPFNKARITFTTAGYTDCDRIEVSSGTVAGGAVDITNIQETLLFDTNRQYVVTTPPMNGGTGTWNYEVAGRDSTITAGNRGTALAVSLAIVSHPKDVQFDANGFRFTHALASQTLTITFTLPS